MVLDQVKIENGNIRLGGRFNLKPSATGREVGDY
jgi:hypothetical protein